MATPANVHRMDNMKHDQFTFYTIYCSQYGRQTYKCACSLVLIYIYLFTDAAELNISLIFLGKFKKIFTISHN
jgi:hypothetical protein